MSRGMSWAALTQSCAQPLGGITARCKLPCLPLLCTAFFVCELGCRLPLAHKLSGCCSLLLLEP